MLNALPLLVGKDLPHPLGWLCPRCGEPMRVPPQPLDAGHTREADKAAGLPGDRLEHAWCNREAGASRAVQPGAGYTPSRQW